jgi:hypothetical protein
MYYYSLQIKMGLKKKKFFQDPHGAIFQRTAFFIVTAVKTSNPTEFRVIVQLLTFDGWIWPDLRSQGLIVNHLCRTCNQAFCLAFCQGPLVEQASVTGATNLVLPCLIWMLHFEHQLSNLTLLTGCCNFITALLKYQSVLNTEESSTSLSIRTPFM